MEPTNLHRVDAEHLAAQRRAANESHADAPSDGHIKPLPPETVAFWVIYLVVVLGSCLMLAVHLWRRWVS